MPKCSPCSLSVDWGRECYASKWYLFRDAPGIATPGVYYFSPQGTPFYNGVHNLWSQRWLDRNNGLQQALGESFSTFPAHVDGAPPAAIGAHFAVGTADCIADGELIENAVDERNIEDGLPSACWVQLPTWRKEWRDVASLDSCGTQYFYCTVLMWLSYGLDTQVSQACSMFFGPDASVTNHLGAGAFPSITTITTPRFSVALIAGTQNIQQLALQAFEGITGPTNAGIFSTLPTWYHQATNAIQFLETDGMVPGTPVLFVGHSYGACSASIAAARCRYKSATRDVRRLTFGSPKPGDERLRHYNLFVPGLDLANDDDIVTALPPDRLTIAPVSATLALALLFIWDEWWPQANVTKMLGDGTLVQDGLPILDYDTLLTFTQRILAHQALPEIFPHLLSEYQRRIFARCPFREWPLSRELWLYLQSIIPPDEAPAMELGAERAQVLALGELGAERAQVLALGELGGAFAGKPIVAELGAERAQVLALGELGAERAQVLALGELGAERAQVLALGELGFDLSQLSPIAEIGDSVKTYLRKQKGN